MQSIEGQLNIDLYPQRKYGMRVELSSSRPLHASKILIGKTPEQALAIIPMVFSVCGIAQSRAALAAIDHASDNQTDPAIEAARDMLVLVENTKEHLFRLFIDWPELFELETSNEQLPYISQMLGEFKSALFKNGNAFELESELNKQLKNVDYLIDKLDHYLQQHVFCDSLENWLMITDISALQQWSGHCSSVAANSINIICNQGWASQGLTDCKQLPLLNEDYLFEKFNADNVEQFIAQPQWQGHCYETTTLTRQFEQPLIRALYQEFQATLITRWVARLVELANVPAQLRSMLSQLVNLDTSITSAYDIKIKPGRNKHNKGMAQIEAARGRLIHRVEFKAGLICNYQILAPTEWNFHPQGLVAKSLNSLANNHSKSRKNAPARRDELEKIARLMINAIDPCVGYELRIH